ncbi:MAG: hypothetical protein HY725_00050 [Candidatus Rokubacteria bacterium]|nr:hypothetical protein [Candidatus Rokubacteria bacterium]
MPTHGWVGLFVVGAAEVLLVAGHRRVGEWFTPIVWTGYILFVDGLVHARTGQSYLTTRRRELPGVVAASIGGWWLFELYNAPRFWRGGADLQGLWWQYHNLEPNFFLRLVGYSWAFATIFPALFLTGEWLKATILAGLSGRRSVRLPGWARAVSICVGGVAVVLPLVVVSQWLVTLVWVGFVLLLEPINYRRNAPSWLRETEAGDYRTLAALLGSGLICGLLWEFWNYWALTKWTYTVPYGGSLKLFEMPVLGYLGFPPFALEAFAMYTFLRSLVAPTDSHPNPLPGRERER